MISVCIAFRNEGEEIFRTILSLNSSIKSTDNIEIIVINDKSSDGYNYSKLFNFKNVKYYINTERLGSSQSKQLAIQLATSDNIFLIDAHMRFQSGWYDNILHYLSINKTKIYCFHTLGFNKDTEKWDPSDHRCAVMSFGGDCQYGGIWTDFVLS